MEQLSIALKANLFSLLLGFAVAKLKTGGVRGVLIAVNDWITTGIGTSYLNAASVNEGGHVFLDAGLEQQLCSCYGKINNISLSRITILCSVGIF